MERLTALIAATEWKIIASVAAVLIVYTLRAVMHRGINRAVSDVRTRYVWRQIVNYAAIAGALLFLGRLWLDWFHSVLTFVSLIAAATVIVSKELILNYIGYMIIIWRGLFNVGDRIQIGTHAGDVMEIGPLYIALAEVGHWVEGDESTGRTIKIPNGQVLTQSVANYSRGLRLIWNEVSADFDAATDIDVLRSEAQKIASDVSYDFTPKDLEDIKSVHEDLKFVRTEPSVYVRWQDSHIRLTIRYACVFFKRRSTEDMIWQRLLTQCRSEPRIRLKGTPAA